MRALLLPVFLFMTLPSWAAAPSGSTAQTGTALCRAAIGLAERAGSVPAGLLVAIGLVESGRRDPQTGAVGAWPWTVTAEGTGHFYESKTDAIGAVQALQARGVRSIDVGCMQINLFYHPTAFATLEDAFDPAANTRYAARFLAALKARTGTWPNAAATYHSATPELAAAYGKRVLAAWPGAPKLPEPGPAPAQPPLAAGSFVVLASGSTLRIVPLADLPGLPSSVLPRGRVAVQLTP